MQPNFRTWMAWLHTWTGLLIGTLLMVIFWMGSLSVFDREIDRWTMPTTRLAPTESMSLDRANAIASPLARSAGASKWTVTLPTDRDPTLDIRFTTADDTSVSLSADPRTGRVLPDPGSLGGTGFFYPLHYWLMPMPRDIGRWFTAFAAMMMIALSVSGVIIHRRIFIDFFTLRFLGKRQRTVLDLHNVTGVLGLPFNILISLSGVIFFYGNYLPVTRTIPYGGNIEAYFADSAKDDVERTAVGRAAPLASLDRMAAEATQRWNGEGPGAFTVIDAGDAQAIVELRRAGTRSVTFRRTETIQFDGPSGAVLFQEQLRGPHRVARFISGMHIVEFRHWTLRWLYFLFGLAGCALIATGFLFWVESRRKNHAQLGLKGTRIVTAVGVGSVTGLVIATLAFMIANRVLPSSLADRAYTEIWAFFGIWLLTFVHAALRTPSAWREQCWMIVIAGIAAVGLNAVTTGDTVVSALATSQWGVAGIDLMILIGAALAWLAALRLKRPAGSTRAALDQAPAAAAP